VSVLGLPKGNGPITNMTPEAYAVMWDYLEDKGWSNWTERDVDTLVEALRDTRSTSSTNRPKVDSVLRFLCHGNPHSIVQRLWALTTQRKELDRLTRAEAAVITELVAATGSHSALREGMRLYKLAGRPGKPDFIRLCGKRGPAMTWVERAKHLGVSTPEEAARKFLCP
jgi:hypothetical protein